MALLESGMANFCVSTNHDALVWSSKENVVEIFGSVLTEVCLGCRARFRRRLPPPPLGRKCELCSSKLKKSGCRYGQEIYRPGLQRAEEASQKADVALVLGSGMHTWPVTASGFPGFANDIFLVTLGETIADRTDDERITRVNAACDDFMTELVNHLDISVPNFEFRQEFVVEFDWHDGRISVSVKAADQNEALVFSTAGFLRIGDIVHELDRSNLTYILGGDFAVPAEVNEVCVQLTPRAEFCDENPCIVKIPAAPNGSIVGEYSKKIIHCGVE